MGALLSRFLGFFSSGKSTSESQSSFSQLNQTASVAAPVQAGTNDAPKVYSWDLRKTVDPKDFTIEKKTGETVVKMPGSINGQQFIIKDLTDCNVFIFDHMAVLSIDDCKNCKFFTGPSKGSVFIRNSVDCALATICQQFRTRDCRNVTTFIVCTSMPIIESSTGMKFGCLTCNYNALSDQLKSANISVFNSNWSTIHDFTRVPGQQNYILLDRFQKLGNYIPYPEESIKRQLGVSYEIKDSIVPFSIGTAAKTSNESCLIVVFFDPVNPTLNQTNARNVVNSITNTYLDVLLINCKNFTLNEISSENVFGTKDYNRQLQRGPVIGLEFNGPNSIAKCQSEIQKLSIDNNQVYVSPPADNLQQRIDNFYNFSDMQMFG